MDIKLVLYSLIRSTIPLTEIQGQSLVPLMLTLVSLMLVVVSMMLLQRQMSLFQEVYSGSHSDPDYPQQAELWTEIPDQLID